MLRIGPFLGVIVDAGTPRSRHTVTGAPCARPATECRAVHIPCPDCAGDAMRLPLTSPLLESCLV
ncbi:MAG TPA: hypothetical protein PLN91_13350, partial [Rhodanobacteraceae bacterium]|nr:hypothetical protein [Rhodanobacteraceae bacterium]